MLIEIEDGPLAGRLALSFEAHEEVSAIGVYRLVIESDDPSLDLASMLGERVDLSVSVKGTGMRRPYSAWITGASDGGRRLESFCYEFELRHWWWFLDQSTDCRIFQSQSVVEICTAIFDQYPQFKYRFELDENYSPREYCVQYRESDYHFIARLLQVEGIYTRLEHGHGGCTLVLSDSAEYPDTNYSGRLQLWTPDAEEGRDIRCRGGVQRLQREPTLRHSTVSTRDYNFVMPEADMEASSVDRAPAAELRREQYLYGGEYDREDQRHGERRSRVRLLAESALARTLRGEANIANLQCGHCFVLANHHRNSVNGRYLLVECRERYLQDEPDSATGRGDVVEVSFKAVPDSLSYKAPLDLTKPRVLGTQSAVVVGPEQTEVHTDEHARIRVHFHWDRYHQREADSSCWMRVIQAWAGRGWGVISLPRVGTEVMINYLDGDIDRPVVMGQVFNGDFPPPYDLPKDVRYTGMVSRSLRYGEPVHASQITFDDSRGAERVKFHAERDEQRHIERNRVLVVKNDAYERVEDTKTREIETEFETERFKISYKAVSVSRKATSNSWTGVRISFTGVSTSTTGVSTSFTGLRNSVTGVSTSTTGLSNGMTGLSNSMTGVSNSVTGVSNSVTGVRNGITGVVNSITGVSNSLTGSSNSVTGVSGSVTGVSTTTTGSSVSATGSSSSVTGVSTSTTGSSVSVTGMRNSVTGVSNSTTGSSVSSTGMRISFTGLSVSYTGVKMSKVGQSITL